MDERLGAFLFAIGVFLVLLYTLFFIEGCALLDYYEAPPAELQVRCEYEATKYADRNNDYLRWLDIYNSCLIAEAP